MIRLAVALLLTLALPGCSALDPSAFHAPASAATQPGAAAQDLASLPVKGPAPMTGYSRAAFMPHGWTDPDGNGCDSRRDALARQAVGQPVLAGPHRCVLMATIADPYSGTNLPSTKVDTDHVVALGDAWQTGASTWPATKRAQLANDALNLLAVSAALNRSKGDSDAASWLPPAKAYRCQYVARQVEVKLKYGLWVTPGEYAAIARVLGTCPVRPDDAVPPPERIIIVAQDWHLRDLPTHRTPASARRLTAGESLAPCPTTASRLKHCGRAAALSGWGDRTRGLGGPRRGGGSGAAQVAPSASGAAARTRAAPPCAP